jgi:hypothetical protein
MSSTISITTEAAALNFASTASLGLVAIVLLLCLLVQKEIVVTGSSPASRTLKQVLNVAIVPLLVVFVVIVSSKVFAVLG